MIAIRAQKLLQIMIGTGKSRDALAVLQAWPVALADLQKVLDRWCEAPGFGLLWPQGPKQPMQSALHGCQRLPVSRPCPPWKFPSAAEYVVLRPRGARLTALAPP